MHRWDRTYAEEANTLLKELEWTKRQAAQEMGISPQTVYNWQNIWPVTAIMFLQMAALAQSAIQENERIRSAAAHLVKELSHERERSRPL